MKNKIEIKKFSPESLTQVKIDEDCDEDENCDGLEIFSRTICIQDKIPELDTICFTFYQDPCDGWYGLSLGVKTNYGDNAYRDISNLIDTLNLSANDVEAAKTKLDDYYDSSYGELESLIQKTMKKLDSKELYLAKQHDKKAKELVLNILNANTTIENIPNEFKPSVKHYLNIRVNQLALSNIFGCYEYVDLPTEVKQVVSITENEYRKLYNLSYEMFATDLVKIVINELAELPITGFNIMLSNSCFINEVITAPGTNYNKETFLNPESRPIDPDPFFYVSLKLSENVLSERCSANMYFYFGPDPRENIPKTFIGPSFSMPNFMPSFNFANLIGRKIEINDYYTNKRVELQMHYFKNETDYKSAVNAFKDELFAYLSKNKDSILSFSSYALRYY